MDNYNNKTISAFTLIELSIVLVIVGMLVGGILAGKSLVRASELRSITVQYQGYVTAIRAFREKYFALPGDMANATEFWGIAAGTGVDVTCRNFVSTGLPTCNGNGDGTLLNVSNKPRESFRLWQHLANAGLISGSYSGVSLSTSYSSVGPANSPTGKLGQAYWYVDSDIYTSANSFAPAFGPPGPFFSATYKHYLWYRTDSSTSNKILKTEEAWNIDAKIDDGKPGNGKVMAYCPDAISTCSTAVTALDTNADYLLTTSSPSVSIVFNNAF